MTLIHLNGGYAGYDGYIGPLRNVAIIGLCKTFKAFERAKDSVGPVESVEALWVDSEGTQPLGHLLVRPLDYVPVLARKERSEMTEAKGSGCGTSVAMLGILFSLATRMVSALF